MKRKMALRSIIMMIILCLTIPTIGFAEESQIEKFTLDEMIERALVRNQLIKKAEFSLESIDITRERANFNLTFFPAAQFSLSAEPIAIYDTHLKINKAYESAKDQLQIEIDSTKYDIINKYQAIINAKENLNIAWKDMEYKRSLMDVAVLKKNMGLISEIEHASAIQAYNIAKRAYEMKLEELNKTFATLNSATGFTEDYRYEIEPSNFADIDKELVDLDLQRLKVLGTDGILIRMMERSLSNTQFSYDYYVFNVGAKPLDAIGEDIKAEQANIAATKNNLSEIIRTIFLNAQETQKNYKDLLAKDEIDRKLHEVKKVQYDLGMITKIDFMESEKTLMENEAKLLALRNGFNELIYMLNFPHVAK